MIKKLIGLLIVILVSLSSLAQSKLDSISVPIWLIDSIADELAVKDGMMVTLNLQSQALTIYAHRDALQTEIIYRYQLNEEQYIKIIEALKETNDITEDQKKELERELRALKRKVVIATIGGIVLIVILILQ